MDVCRLSTRLVRLLCAGCTYAEAMAADQRVAEMLRLNDDRNKAVSDMARLAYLLTHLGGGKGGGNNRSRKRGEDRRKMFRVRQALEASFVDEAEIVFTTLASSSRRVFRQLTHGFDTVLIDEAGHPFRLYPRFERTRASFSRVKNPYFFMMLSPANDARRRCCHGPGL